jgi:hypothetical protein
LNTVVHVEFLVPIAHRHQILFPVLIGKALAIFHQDPTFLRKSDDSTFSFIVEEFNSLAPGKSVHGPKIMAFCKMASTKKAVSMGFSLLFRLLGA